MLPNGHVTEVRSPPGRPPLSQLILTFLKIGAIGFGGGMAIIAIMEREIVRVRRWLSAEEFLHGVGLGQVLGPFAINTAFFVGYRLHGPVGALVGAGSFAAPSMVLVLVLSWLYFSYHTIPALQAALLGASPVVIALIIGAAWSMGRMAVRTLRAAALLTLSFLLGVLYTFSAVYILVGAGAVGLLLGRERIGGAKQLPDSVPNTGSPAKDGRGVLHGYAGALFAITPSASGVTLLGLAFTFFKVGLIFFGGGYVLLPLLYQRLVTELAWLSPQQFLDGVAISNLTPGPISVLATFIGYKFCGVAGALVATVGLYLPALALMFVLCYGYGRLQGGAHFQDFFAGMTPALVGIVLSAAVLLGRRAIVSWQTALFAFLACILLVRFRWPPAVTLALGALLGVLGLLT
jgi:chromate transporter